MSWVLGASHRSCQQKSEIKMNEMKIENLNLSTWNPEWPSGKESACNAGDVGLIDPWVRKIHWRRKWQPTTVLLPGKSHGQNSLAGCSPRGCKSRTWLTDWLSDCKVIFKDLWHLKGEQKWRRDWRSVMWLPTELTIINCHWGGLGFEFLKNNGQMFFPLKWWD